jgi:hypothetical protein
MTKKAEGPFVLKSMADGLLVCKFKPTGSIAMFHYPVLLAEQVNIFLSDWLRSAPGRKWMKERGIIPVPAGRKKSKKEKPI